MKSIKNGGLELGIFNIVGDENLSDADKERKAYLESLPKNRWITLDENSKAISDDEASLKTRQELERYGIKK